MITVPIRGRRVSISHLKHTYSPSNLYLLVYLNQTQGTRNIQPLVGNAMSRATTTLLLLGLHSLGASIGVFGARLRLVNAIYSGADNLSLIEWTFDRENLEEAIIPKAVTISFEHDDFDPELHTCYPNEASAQAAQASKDRVNEYCVQLATVNGMDFRSKPLVPLESGVYIFRLTCSDGSGTQTVRSPKFEIDVDVPGLSTVAVVDHDDQVAPTTTVRNHFPFPTHLSTGKLRRIISQESQR